MSLVARPFRITILQGGGGKNAGHDIYIWPATLTLGSRSKTNFGSRGVFAPPHEEQGFENVSLPKVEMREKIV